MTEELHLDDVDLDRLRSWRRGVLANPIVATMLTQDGDGPVVRSHVRLRDLPKPLRRRFKRAISQRGQS